MTPTRDAAPNRQKTSVLRAGLLSAAIAVVGAEAFAQQEVAPTGLPEARVKMRNDYLGYAASVSARASYTDNINLLPSPFDDDEAFVSTLFTASGVLSSNRLSAVFDGDLDFSYLADNGDLNVSQRIGAAATATIADNLAYIDFGGSTSRQLVGDNARFSPNINAGRNQQVNVHSFGVSPYLRHEFSRRQVGELRYRFSQVFIDEGPGGVGQFLNDSTSHEARASYDTGEALGRLRARLVGYGNTTVESGSLIAPRIEYEQFSGFGELEFSLTDRFALTGAVGYDDVTTDAPIEFIDGDAVSGVFWRAGFRAQPGRKTDVRVEYGERYNGDFIHADIRYRMSDRVSMFASANRQFVTRAQGVEQLYGDQQQRVLDFVETLRAGGDPQSPAGIVQAFNQVPIGFGAQTIGFGVVNFANAGVIASSDRTTVGLTAIYQDSDFGFRDIRAIGGNLSLQRQLSRRLAAYGDLFYRFADTEVDLAQCIANPALFGIDPTDPSSTPADRCAAFAAQNGVSDTIGGRIGARYQFYRNLSVFGEYTRTSRLSDSPLLEYDENFVSAGLTYNF